MKVTQIILQIVTIIVVVFRQSIRVIISNSEPQNANEDEVADFDIRSLTHPFPARLKDRDVLTGPLLSETVGESANVHAHRLFAAPNDAMLPDHDK